MKKISVVIILLICLVSCNVPIKVEGINGEIWKKTLHNGDIKIHTEDSLRETNLLLLVKVLNLTKNNVYFYIQNAENAYANFDKGTIISYFKDDFIDNSVNDKVVKIDSITCEIFLDRGMYIRVLTSKRLSENKLKKAKDALKITKTMVYFHLPDYKERGEEYAALISEQPYVYDDIVKVEKKAYNAEPTTSRKKPVIIEGEIARYASIIARDFVKRKLLSPESADFSSDEIVEDYSDDIYTVLSYVDAKNAYGTKIRTRYKLKLKWNRKEWTDISNWTLLDSRYE